MKKPAPADLFDPSRRVMFVFAHQDDELAYAGLVQRAPRDSLFVWLTNGDGIAEESGMGRAEYAAARQLETTVAMNLCGVPRDRLRFLGHSEHAIYHQLIRLKTEPRAAHEVQSYFRDVAATVAAEVRAFRPDVLFTLAWQGGHPEHDLSHVMAVAAVADRPGVAVFELPEYELMHAVPMRFRPGWKGDVHEIRLTPAEMEVKRRVADAYPTQARIVNEFRTILTWVGRAASLVGRGFTPDGFLSVEHFGPVPRGRDYGKSPHGLDFLDYIREDCDGVPVRYESMVGAVAKSIAG